MQDRLKFRAYYQGRFIYKSLTDANYYDKDNKCIGLANTLPNNLKWEQYTGFEDKVGKHIYESDIVELTRSRNYGWCRRGAKLKVQWNTFNCCGFGFGAIGNLTRKCAQNCIVIGNVHQNPELLEELSN